MAVGEIFMDVILDKDGGTLHWNVRLDFFDWQVSVQYNVITLKGEEPYQRHIIAHIIYLKKYNNM